MLCLWEVSDCTNSGAYAGTMYSDCSGDHCSCSGEACECGDTPPIDPGMVAMVDDEVLVSTRPESSFKYVSVEHPFANRTKRIRNNRAVLNYVVPAPSRMVPSDQWDEMAGWGEGDWTVRYIKCLRLNVTPGNRFQYYALYKLYDDVQNPNGTGDEASDRYIGFRVSQRPSQTPGGLAQANFNTNNSGGNPNVVRLGRNTANNYMELGVRVVVPREYTGQGSGNPHKWFHLYGMALNF